MSDCRRCGATLRDATKTCGVCRVDRVEAHIRTLVVGARSKNPAVLQAKADAAAALRSLGFTQLQVVEVRAKAFDCYSVSQVLEGLAGVEQVGAVA
jgi:hypothetical protein